MKLLTKLTLFITLSKGLIILLFILLLPVLVNQVSLEYTNHSLRQQEQKVMESIHRKGVDYYLQGDSAYGSYTMLKEEYISLVRNAEPGIRDTVQTSLRIVDSDTINYRMLIHPFVYGEYSYVLEIGKTTEYIGQYNTLLQRFALFVLIALIALSMILDLLYTHILLKPLHTIVRTKLINRKFPLREPLLPVNTSTKDFQYLDRSIITLMEDVQETFEKEREFTSNASHELMTPITILQSTMENLMMTEGLSEAMQEKLHANMKTLARLKKIVHSLLYLARIDNDQFIRADTIPVHELIDEVIEELDTRAQLRSITITNTISPSVQLRSVNRELIFQLFYNIINNAIRYNKENGTVEVSGRYDHVNAYCVLVKDTGKGIAAEALPALFNRFKKAEPDNAEGHGLGLSIVQSIASSHDLHVTVQSQPGIGSVFCISFPRNNCM